MNQVAYHALHHDAAWIELEGRGKIRVTGEDRVRLLHAMASNNIQDLQPGMGCYTFFLNAQGRILADANLFVLPDYILLDTEPLSRERLVEHLDKYIIADDVTLEDVTDQYTTVAIGGPEAEQKLRSLGATVARSECGISEWGTRQVAWIHDGIGLLVFLPKTERDAFLADLRSAGVVETDRDTLNTVRLELHRPRFGVDFSDTWIPQETQQMHAVHFNKGCYLGQEIVERVRARGHLNKMLVPFEIETMDVPAAQARVMADGKDAGYITSAALSPHLQKVVAMGMLRMDAVGKELTVNGAQAIATNLPAATSKR